MTSDGTAGHGTSARGLPLALAIAGLVVLLAVAGLVLGSSAKPRPTLLVSPTADLAPSATQITRPTPSPTPTPRPSPTPAPTPVLVPAPLTGRLVAEVQAAQHPIAVMIDDHPDARPQAGFNAASVVWQAPAEGGIPRYMVVFGETVPGLVGPVRSARQYYIEWAAEWRALYVHSGGSPGALQTLRQSGRGQLVWNGDEFRWGGTYLWRSKDRPSPHNVYTDGEHLRALAATVGAVDGPLVPAWTFSPPIDGDARPVGAQIRVVYPTESVTYRYQAASNTWLRFIDDAPEPQRDAADGAAVAPTNVIVLRIRFGRLDDGSGKDRLEAATIGEGEAWIGTNGRIVHGSWRKDSATSPTLVLDAAGQPVALAAGQTFVQVLPLAYDFAITPGRITPIEMDRRTHAPR